MKWIEIIDFRSLNANEALNELELWKQLAEVKGKADVEAIDVYHHSTLATDISIHLHYESDQMESQGSPFGVRLVSELKAFGVVNHTVWVEKRDLP